MTTDRQHSERGQWSSKLGFILAAAGSAIGLGNIWRFPYVTGQNGGAVFLFVYLVCVLLLGVPVMIAELTLGRHARKNPVGAIEAIRTGSRWKIVGYLGVLTGLCIFSYYGVIAGYTLGYIFKTLVGNAATFEAFAANPALSFPLFALFIVLTVLVVQGGVREGIERWSRILMPLLLVMLLVLIIRSVTLPGAEKGLEFYLKPDFGKVDGRMILEALGQAFFSLSLGMGCMITYGSYLSKKDNIVTSGLSVAFFDTLIAVMAGLLIFPALFAMGKSPAEGTGLVFSVLPGIFSSLPAGNVIGALFFLLLSIAALTSTISLLEVVTAWFVDERRIRRRRAVWITAMLAFLLGIPSALSSGMVPWLGRLPLVDMDFFSLMGLIFGTISLAVGALLISLFFGWVWKMDNAAEEIASGCSWFGRWKGLFGVMLKFVCPACILVLLLFLLFGGD